MHVNCRICFTMKKKTGPKMKIKVNVHLNQLRRTFTLLLMRTLSSHSYWILKGKRSSYFIICVRNGFGTMFLICYSYQWFTDRRQNYITLTATHLSAVCFYEFSLYCVRSAFELIAMLSRLCTLFSVALITNLIDFLKLLK